MTTVDFYVNASDKLALAVRLLNKALQQQRQVTALVTDGEQAKALSEQLWQAAPTSFLANVVVNGAQSPNHAPILIQTVAGDYQQDDVLINLSPKQPASFSRFTRLIELVTDDEADKAAARERYAFYKARGYAVKHTDMLKQAS